jgi:tetratricopeptide (TPR) repeat protein
MDHEGGMDPELNEPGRIEWGERIRRERERRGWSQSEAVAQLRRTTREQHKVELADDESLLRSWKRWEAGGGIRQDNQRYLATLFQSVPGALFPPPRRIELLPSGDIPELLQQLQASSVDNSSLYGVMLTVEKLCSEYAYTPAEQLITEGRAWLARLVQLIQKPMTLAQRREVQVQAGWLALLVACVQYDSGDARSAEVTRRHALSLGSEAGHAGIQGWAHEISAWQALTSGNYRGVLTATQAGAAVAGNQGVSVQLAAQEAKALARMGDPKAALEALDRGRRLLEPMEYPTNIGNHFVVDPAKYDFYAMDVYRHLSSDDAAAEQLAHEVLAAGTDWDGSERSVMRNAEARITLGTVAARRGDVDGAVEWGIKAISADRKSLPSLLMVARDLSSAIDAVAADSQAASQYRERLRDLGGR